MIVRPLLFQASLGSVAPASMGGRLYRCMCNIDRGSAASPASAAAGVGVVREQLVIFLADTLRGTAEERAPLVLTMSQPGAMGGTAGAVTARQVTEVSRSVALKPERQLLEHLSSSSSLICYVFLLLATLFHFSF